MSALNHIISSCTVGHNTVCKDGARLFTPSPGHPDEISSQSLNDFLMSIYRSLQLDYPKFYKMDQLSKLGWLASELVLRDFRLPEEWQPEDIGIVLTNANSSLDTDIKYLDTVKDIPSPAVFVYTLPNIMIGEISIRNKFKGENAFFIFDRFDAAFLEQYVGQLLDTGLLKACICGWVDVLGEEYRAAVFLVTHDHPGDTASPTLFTKENLDKIFMEENGNVSK
ncbi:hypothetical protein Q4E93_05245 [Flavitalea sp. BT771]|uniref:hypothetical protein n=1 Tax=Flavitalea sp. BT771 TaxID=3063329 RepID=UPI0026E380B4|nr:hypothetical protein [Flavitalea sp. BT771]MDO6429977.1 hypothetical protein [Flavitalea sp. BT771]MDV6217895.1 hypothetical protein [Flavitalea sp. BT771]